MDESIPMPKHTGFIARARDYEHFVTSYRLNWPEDAALMDDTIKGRAYGIVFKLNSENEPFDYFVEAVMHSWEVDDGKARMILSLIMSLLSGIEFTL